MVSLEQWRRECALVINCLHEEQNANGSFKSTTSYDKDLSLAPQERQTTFYASSIALSLAEITEADYFPAQERLADFLCAERREGSSYNYWTRDSVLPPGERLPDDLDDTCLGLSALTRLRPEAITGETLAEITMLLSRLEVKLGGPYYTWAAADCAPEKTGNVDVVVNSNIAYFLSLYGVTLPPLERYLDEALSGDPPQSPFYFSPYPVLYALARSHGSGRRIQLTGAIAARQTGPGIWLNPFFTALMVSALIRCQSPLNMIESGIQSLLAWPTNVWDRPYAYVIEKTAANTVWYSGSRAFSAAARLEALALYRSLPRQRPTVPLRSRAHQLYDRITRETARCFASCGPDMQTAGLDCLAMVLRQDTDQEIGLLPYYAAQALETPNQIRDHSLTELGRANMMGWIAYTIYDRIMDGGRSERLLPVANLCLRNVTAVYSKLFASHPEALALFHGILDQLEEANYWELTNARAEHTEGVFNFNPLPEFADLSLWANRSLGHAAGVAAVTVLSGYSPTGPEVEQTIKFMRHYLGARQIHDDIHDWEEDLDQGRITPIVALLLRKFSKKHGDNGSITLAANKERLRSLFWHEVLAEGNQLILREAKKAQDILSSAVYIKNPDYLARMADRMVQAASAAEVEALKIRQFIKRCAV